MSIEESMKLIEAGAIPQAVALAEAARHQPEQRADALHLLGIAAAQEGDGLRALDFLGQAVAADPENLERKLNYGTLALDLGSTDIAVEALAEVAQHAPGNPAAQSLYGNALVKVGRFEEAVEAQERALGTAPNHPLLWGNLASAYLAWGKLEAADAGNRHAVGLGPEEPELHFALGSTRFMLGKLDEAIGCFQQALDLDPDHAKARTSLGVSQRLIGQLELGRLEQERAFASDPEDLDVRWNLALTHLFHGEWTSGWSKYESRREREPQLGREGFGQPWDGKAAPEQTVVIEREQGLGDTLMFARFLPAAARRVGKLVFRSQERLCPFLQESLQAAGVEIAPFELEPYPGLYAPLMSLPHLLNTAGDLQPLPTPYLEANADRVKAWAERLGPRTRPRVGLVWQGNPGYNRDAFRSVPLQTFEPLLAHPGLEVFSLQQRDGLEQLEALTAELRPRSLGPLDEEGAFLDTAAVMAHLDLVVTVDSAPVHLAGALGVETALVLGHYPDWRWGQGPKAWYPSVTAFAQPRAADWKGALDVLMAHLETRFGL